MRWLRLTAVLVLSSALSADDLWKKHVLYSGDQRIRTASAADFTGDGLPDIISSCNNQLILFAGPDFQPQFIAPELEFDFIFGLAADIDQDGRLDYLACTHYNPNLIAWFQQPENPTQETWPMHTVSERPAGIHSVATADLNEDGRLDIVATSSFFLPAVANRFKADYSKSIVWLESPENPSESHDWSIHRLADGDAIGSAHYLEVADINSDGLLDVSVAARETRDVTIPSSIAWWESSSDPTVPWKKHLISEAYSGSSHLIPADFNGDGQMDFAFSRGHAKGIYWLEGPDWKECVVHGDIQNPHALLAQDLDGDGDIDMANCAYGSREAWVYLNDGYGSFEKTLIAKDQASYHLSACDLDLDGDLDLLVAGDRSHNVVWLENPGW